jgi:predicted nucleic-acid-binding Zn-ribbon protein
MDCKSCKYAEYASKHPEDHPEFDAGHMLFPVWARAAIGRGMSVRGEGAMDNGDLKMSTFDRIVHNGMRASLGGHEWLWSFGPSDWTWRALPPEERCPSCGDVKYEQSSGAAAGEVTE